MSEKDKRIKLQLRLRILIDEIGYNLYELGNTLKEEGKVDLQQDIHMASGSLAVLTDKLEENKYDFSRSVEIWIEGREEWDEAAWTHIKSQG